MKDIIEVKYLIQVKYNKDNWETICNANTLKWTLKTYKMFKGNCKKRIVKEVTKTTNKIIKKGGN